MTRFGEISPLWQKFTSLWQIFDSFFLIWQNAEPTLAILWHYWANFHCCKWPNIEKIKPPGNSDIKHTFFFLIFLSLNPSLSFLHQKAFDVIGIEPWVANRGFKSLKIKTNITKILKPNSTKLEILLVSGSKYL